MDYGVDEESGHQGGEQMKVSAVCIDVQPWWILDLCNPALVIQELQPSNGLDRQAMAHRQKASLSSPKAEQIHGICGREMGSADGPWLREPYFSTNEALEQHW